MQIKELPDMKFVGMTVTTTMEDVMKDTPKLWDEYMKRSNEIKNQTNPNIHFAICVEEEGETFDYTTCTEVNKTPSEKELPEKMGVHEISKCKYAVFEHKGDVMKMGETYKYIVDDALPNRELKSTGIWLERYDERFKFDSEDSVMEIWASIE